MLDCVMCSDYTDCYYCQTKGQPVKEVFKLTEADIETAKTIWRAARRESLEEVLRKLEFATPPRIMNVGDEIHSRDFMVGSSFHSHQIEVCRWELPRPHLLYPDMSWVYITTQEEL